MDDPSSRSRYYPSAAYAGNHSFLFLSLLGIFTLLLYWWLSPPFAYVFGRGWAGPFTIVLIGFGFIIPFRKRLFKQLFGKAPDESEAVLMEYFAQQNNHHFGQADDHVSVEMELIENALHLREVSAGECMTRKEQVVYAAVSSSVEEVRRIFAETQLSRILITQDPSLDRVLGYIHVQQLFTHPVSVREMTLPIRFVPAHLPVNELLNRFVRTRTNIACVVDETGRLAGIITLEDVLEQLFGAIDDEHD